MSEKHDHEADEHYHGEPSRVLDDVAFPEVAALYPGDPENGFFGSDSLVRDKDVQYWADQLTELNSVQRLAVPGDLSPDTSMVEPTLNFGEETFGGFLPDDLLEEASLLFIPARLRMDEDGWSDLAKNDVTVNWLSLDPDRTYAPMPEAVVLSDWIVSISDDVPRGRSAGATPGIFHLKQDTLNNFLINLNESENPWVALDDLLDDADTKLRPGFIRDRDWDYET